MNTIPTLPELDLTNEETMTKSAEARAEFAVNVASGPLYWKNQELKYTVSRKALFHMLQRLDGLDDNVGERYERDAILLMYLCTQPPDRWNESRNAGSYTLTPLRSRPADWLAEIDQWADENIGVGEINDLCDVVVALLAIHHAPRPASDIEGPEDEKKNTLTQSGTSA